MSILLRSLQNKCISTLQPSVEGLTAYRYGSTHISIITVKLDICNIQSNKNSLVNFNFGNTNGFTAKVQAVFYFIGKTAFGALWNAAGGVLFWNSLIAL